VDKFVDNSLDTHRMEPVTMPRGGSVPPALYLAGAFRKRALACRSTPGTDMISKIAVHACQGAPFSFNPGGL
jgi:hypothetical protein